MSSLVAECAHTYQILGNMQASSQMTAGVPPQILWVGFIPVPDWRLGLRKTPPLFYLTATRLLLGDEVRSQFFCSGTQVELEA